MNPRYALLQKTLDAPPADKLRNAFRCVTFLTDADAHILGRDAYGILVKNLNAAEAGRLQEALRNEGVETEIVAEQLLPQLPPTKFVRRVQFGPDALLLFDPLGRPFPLEWRHIMLVAAGTVPLQNFVRTKTVRRTVRFNVRGDPDPDTEVDYGSREESRFHHLVEVIVTGAGLRYSMDADRQLLAQALGSRFVPEQDASFSEFVRTLLQSVPHAAMNRGAYYLRHGTTPPLPYPSKNAFFEEITWLLWHMKGSS